MSQDKIDKIITGFLGSLLFIVHGNLGSRLFVKLQCPDHPFYVIFMDSLCGFRVNFRKHPVEISISFFLCQLLQSVSVSPVCILF